MIGVEFTGMKELQQKFATLSQMDRKKFFVSEFKPIGKTLVSAMKAQTPVYKGKYWSSQKYGSRNHPRGTMRESIGMKIGGNEIPVVWVSPNRKSSRDAWYSHIVLGGHNYNNVSIRPNPVIKRTWDAIGGIIEGQLEMRMQNKLKAMMK